MKSALLYIQFIRLLFGASDECWLVLYTPGSFSSLDTRMVKAHQDTMTSTDAEKSDDDSSVNSLPPQQQGEILLPQLLTCADLPKACFLGTSDMMSCHPCDLFREECCFNPEIKHPQSKRHTCQRKENQPIRVRVTYSGAPPSHCCSLHCGDEAGDTALPEYMDLENSDVEDLFGGATMKNNQKSRRRKRKKKHNKKKGLAASAMVDNSLPTTPVMLPTAVSPQETEIPQEKVDDPNSRPARAKREVRSPAWLDIDCPPKPHRPRRILYCKPGDGVIM